MTDSKDDSSDIAKRLEQLNQWQEEQKKILFERQNNQRKLLGLEHKKMYELLGIFNSNNSSFENDVIVNDASDNDKSLGIRVPDETAGKEGENLEQIEPQTVKPKRQFLRRKQGLMTRFKLDPDKFRLNNLPPYKFSSSHPSLKKEHTKIHMASKHAKPESKATKNNFEIPVSKAVLKLTSTETTKKYPNIDSLEEKFQQSLITSKTACNSTPDTKSQMSSIKETPEPISWATILDPKNIKPVGMEAFSSRHRESLSETDNLSIFELLEEKARNGSLDMNSSYIKRFLKKDNNVEEEDDTLATSFSTKLPPIPYEVYQNSKALGSDSTDTEVEEDDNSPRPSSRVRFADTLTTDGSSTKNDSKTMENSDSSQVFEEFKRLLFANMNDTTLTDVSQNSGALAQEILQKADLIKTRLQELESQLATFKRANLELMKSKQQHELEKAHFKQERIESIEKLNDERIQMEIYLHDERMKIEDDRKKMEKQIRTQKSLAVTKDKKEIAQFRSEIESLQRELKKKEESHLGTQSRLRAQVRNLEKDVRQLNFDIDGLNKEIKRLEAENLKINRQNNNRMLQEINRNIAKLAPKEFPLPKMEEGAEEKISTIKFKQPKLKPTTHRNSAEAKRKPSLVKQRNLPSSSTDEDSISESSDDLINPPSKVSIEKSLTLPSQRRSTDKVVSSELANVIADASFKREIRNPDGSKDIWYPNGNLKKISADGMNIRMLYFNKDIKETDINEGTVKYYYAETNTWHTTYLDGLEILEFPNGQTEHRYKDGKVEIHFPNNSIKVTNPSDEHKLEEWRFADGTNLINMKNGDKILLLSNGQKEIHTALSKRREYPDGTVKLVYPDGSQETRYSNGRVRLKDKDGNLVMDTENSKYQ